jgi:hypothetical protein
MSHPPLREGAQRQVILDKWKAAKHRQALMYLAPEIAADPNYRDLYQNFKVKAACPVFQRGILETTTVDVGDHQVRGVLLVPHAACPVMLSHSSVTAMGGCLFDAKLGRNGRLVEECRGYYGGNQRMPYFRAFEAPALWDLAIGGSVAFPIHGSYYSPTTITGTSALAASTSVMLRDFTEVLNNGVGTNVRAIPAAANDTVSIVAELRKSVAWVDNDLNFRVGTTNSAGTITYTATPMSGPAAASTVIGKTITLPAGAVGITSCEMVDNKGVAQVFDFASIRITHQVNSAVIDNSTGLGSYVGSPVSGLASLAPVCQSARVTAISGLVTNTASALNANGFIITTATQNALPGNAGIYGENAIASLTSSRSSTVVNGAYLALAPAIDLDYGPLDCLPDLNLGVGIFVIQSQDATAITLKVEYNLVVEVISQDPLFPAMHQHVDMGLITTIQQMQEVGGYLINCENPLHWSTIGSTLSRFLKPAARAVVKGFKTALPIARKVNSVAAFAGIPGATQLDKALSVYDASRAAAKTIRAAAKGKKRAAMRDLPQLANALRNLA